MRLQADYANCVSTITAQFGYVKILYSLCCDKWTTEFQSYDVLLLQLLDLPGIIEGAKDGKGRGKQVIAGIVIVCSSVSFFVFLSFSAWLKHCNAIMQNGFQTSHLHEAKIRDMYALWTLCSGGTNVDHVEKRSSNISINDH